MSRIWQFYVYTKEDEIPAILNIETAKHVQPLFDILYKEFDRVDVYEVRRDKISSFDVLIRNPTEDLLARQIDIPRTFFNDNQER